jgi:hypothetical protein
MKTRLAFVSNSSSCSFIIKNRTNEKKTLVDFVEENPSLVEEFSAQYDLDTDQKTMLKCAAGRLAAEPRLYTFRAKEKKSMSFGDEDGDSVGIVFDYMLRYGGKSKSFSWEFEHFLR